MKRITTLMLAAALCFSGVSAASAIDLKATGVWDFAGGWTENVGFPDSGHGFSSQNDQDSWSARQRLRTQVNFIASEQLQGVLAFEIGTLDWGSNNSWSNGRTGTRSGGALDADGVNVETRRAYIDWLVPNSDISVRMGIQNLALPGAAGMGNPIISDDVAGIVVSTPFNDFIGATAFWARPFDNHGNDNPGSGDRWDEADVFGLLVPVTGEGWSVTPYGMYASVGNASGFYTSAFDAPMLGGGSRPRADGYWGGVAVKIDILDPLTFGLDAMYGYLEPVSTGLAGWDKAGTRGWFIDAALNYKLDWATPGIFGWYGSGDDDNAWEDSKMGRLPVLGTSDGDGFYPTSFGFPGGAGPTKDGQVAWTGTGTWGVGVQLADMSFIENLSHTLRVAYYQGTNDKENAQNWSGRSPAYSDEMYLTTKDHVIEVNFDHKYQIYENLAAYLELGYLHLKTDSDLWGNPNFDDNDDAWKAQLLFKYSF